MVLHGTPSESEASSTGSAHMEQTPRPPWLTVGRRLLALGNFLVLGTTVAMFLAGAMKGELSKILVVLFRYYRDLMEGLFGWAHAPIQTFLNIIGNIIGIKITLYPDWKHVGVFMAVYLSANAITDRWRGRSDSASYLPKFGMPISFVTGVMFGTVGPADPQYFAVIYFVLGLFCFMLIQISWDSMYQRMGTRTFRQTFTYYIYRDLAADVVIGLSVVVAAYRGAGGSHVDPVLWIVLFTLLLAARNIILGVYLALFRREGS